MFYYFLFPLSVLTLFIYEMFKSTINIIFFTILSIIGIFLIILIIIKIIAYKTYSTCNMCNSMNTLINMEFIQGCYICHNCLKKADYSSPYNNEKINPEIVKTKLRIKELRTLNENNISSVQNIKNEKTYYPNNALKSETIYINNIKEGIQKEYYSTGQLKKETIYKNNKKEEIAIEYFTDGALSSVTPYKNNNIEGIVKVYYPNGTLYLEIPYKNNKKEGIAIQYDMLNNLPILKTTYENNKKNGIESRYSYNYKGKLLYEILFENNIAINGKCHNGKQWNNAELHNYTIGLQNICSDCSHNCEKLNFKK